MYHFSLVYLLRLHLETTLLSVHKDILHSIKLPRDKTFTVRSQYESIHEKTFAFATKQSPQLPKHFEIPAHAVQAKTAKSTKVLAPKRFVLYGKVCIYH